MKLNLLDRRRVMLSAGAASTVLMTGRSFAREFEIYMDQGGLFGRAWDYAIGGYDAVAYYALEESASPIEGYDAYTTDFKDVAWRFSSQENLEKFEADPDRYRPQYGGYCAWAMAREKLAKGDPKVWFVHGGKLYLNVSPRYQREWLSDIEAEIARGDANWPGILDMA